MPPGSPQASPEPTQGIQEPALAEARVEIHVLRDQLRQARADLHRLGIADQNRALLYATLTGALGLLCGLGLRLRRREPLARPKT
ncbi:MAG: hypothetical protein H6711_26880 [Myxococcales bacterium]|nr:hypothetical protein [Myxococcales bacterium]